MKHPEGSIPCNRCHTDMVVVDRNYTCDCDIRKASRVDPAEGNRLRQAVNLLRERPATCDRCQRNTAFRLVACHLGCLHAQCFGCADSTKAEAIEEEAYAGRVEVVEEVTIVEEDYSFGDDDYYGDVEGYGY